MSADPLWTRPTANVIYRAWAPKVNVHAVRGAAARA